MKNITVYPTPSLTLDQQKIINRIEALSNRLKMPPSYVEFLMKQKGKINKGWI